MKTTTKRKMYQKRRKKEKADQRKKELQAKQLASTAAATYKYNNNGNKQNPRNLPTINNNYHQHHSSSPITSYSQSLQIWWQTYCSAIEFHTRQQNAWKDESKDMQLMLLQKYANEYETSSEEEEENDYLVDTVQPQVYSKNLDHANLNDKSPQKNVDEEYIKFLEITHKHRKELMLKRAGENI